MEQFLGGEISRSPVPPHSPPYPPPGHPPHFVPETGNGAGKGVKLEDGAGEVKAVPNVGDGAGQGRHVTG